MNFKIKPKSLRIIRRVYFDNTVKYIIQKRHWFFKIWWLDACDGSFNSLSIARSNLHNFEKNKFVDKVIEYV